MEYPLHIAISYPYYVDRHLLNDLIRGVEVEVVEPFKLMVNGSEFTAKTPLPVGQRVIIKQGQLYAKMYLKGDLDAYDTWRAQQRSEQEAKQKEGEQTLRQARKQASIDFYARYTIPFAFSIEIKESLSGLSASSYGDGQKRNTVYHVFTQDAISLGRITRKKYDFLCSPVQSEHGGNWSESLGKDTHQLEDGIARLPTCKKCLELLERFKVEKP